MGYLEITTTAPCSINCSEYCPQSRLKQVYSGPALLSEDDFTKALDHIDPEVGICFSGYGEPFLNPHCVDMILQADRRGHSILVFSTLSNIRVRDWKRIENIPFASFCVHLPDKKGITRVRVTAEYLEVLKSIVTKPYSSFMAMAEPLDDVVPIVAPVFHYGESYHFVNNERAGNLESRKRREYHGRINCGKLSRPQYVMLPDGTTTLCCQDWGLKHKLGNIFEEDFLDLYESQEMQRVLKSANSFNDSYALCRHCAAANTTFLHIKRQAKSAFISTLKEIGIHPLAKRAYRTFCLRDTKAENSEVLSLGKIIR